MEKIYNFERLTKKVRAFVALAFIMLLAAGNVFADQVTYVFADAGYENAAELGNGTINDLFSFTTSKGSASNMPKFYEADGARFYYHGSGNGNSMTIAVAEGYKITGLELAAIGSYTPTVGYIADEGDAATVSVEGGVYSISGLSATQSLKFYNANTTNTQLRIISLKITYSAIGDDPIITVTKPTFSLPTGTYYSSKTVSLECETEGANIYFSIDEGDAVLYNNSPLFITETTTIKAYAVKGEVQSSIATVTYTIINPTAVENIAVFKNLPDDETVIYKLNSDVTYNFGANHNYYVQDTTAGLLIYDQNTQNPVFTNSYNPGDIIKGGIIGKRKNYNGLVELIVLENPAEGEAGEENVAIKTTMADIIANPDVYMSKLVTLSNCRLGSGEFKTTSTNNVAISQGKENMQMRNVFRTIAQTFTAGKYATVTGFVGVYNNTLQIYPRNAADVQIFENELPLVCDFDENKNSWMLVNGNTNLWYEGAAQGFDNNKLYISSTLGATNKYNTAQAAVSHAWMPVSLPASDVILSFDYRSNGENNKDFLQISIVDNDTLVVAGVLPTEYLERLNGTTEFKNHEIVIPASYAGNKILVFTWSNDNSNGNQTPAAVDNISIKATCTAPTNLETLVESRTATINWIAPEAQNTWTVEYKAENDNAWYSQVVTGEPTLTLTDLATQVTYDVRVKANCGEQSSAWLKGKFTVSCIELTEEEVNVTIGNETATSRFPFYAYYNNSWVELIYPSTNFETAGFINSLSWEVSSVSAHQYNSLKIYLGTTANSTHSSYTNWISMEDLTLVYQNDNGSIASALGWETYTLQTPFYYNGEDNLVVVISRTANNWSSCYYRSSNSSNAVLYRYNDTNLEYAEHPGTNTGTMTSTLPNMKVDYLGYVCGDVVCAVPTELEISDVTANSAKVTWEGEAETYRVAYKAENEEEWTIEETNATEITLANLLDNTNYELNVKAECGEVGASAKAVATFKTVAECKVPTNLAVSHSVENTTITWVAVENAESYELEYGKVGAEETMNVVIENASSFVISSLNENTQYKVQVRSICGEEKYSDWASITFTRPIFCTAPTEVEITDITENTAIVAWNQGDASSWTIEYGEKGFVTGEGTVVTTNNPTVTLTGLTSNTTYDLYIKANCNSFLSPWSSAKSFTTDCGPYTITNNTPWFENFEGYSGSGEKNFDKCWATPVKSSSNAPFVYCGYSPAAYSGNNSAELKGTTDQENLLVLPAFTNDISTLQLTFYANTTASSVANAGTFEVGYVTDAEDGSTFVALQTITPTSAMLSRSNSVLQGPFNFSEVTAANARMAIYFKSSYGSYSATSWNLDDFTVSIIPNCQAPTGVSASNIDVDNATISWNVIGDATSWAVIYGPQGFEPEGDGTTVEENTTFTIENLEESTAYDVYVRTVCGPNNTSVWVGPVSFTTNSACTYTLLLHDSYGDGWNGGKITFSQGGNTQNFTVSSGKEASYIVNLEKGVEATFTYTAGSYSYENSFEILAPDGSTFWSLSTGTGNSGASMSVTCGESTPISCVVPSELVIDNITENSAVLSWTGGAEETYQVEYRLATADMWATVTTTGNTYTLTDLTANNTYVARVKAVCDEENQYTDQVMFFVTSGSICYDRQWGIQESQNNYLPIGTYFKNSYTQQIFDASEVGQSGMITKLSFNFASNDLSVKSDVKIYLANVDKSTFDSSTDWVTEGLVEVYSGNFNCVQGWNEFELSNPFLYDDSKNLLLTISDNSGNYQSSKQFWLTFGTENKSIYWRNDYSSWSSTNTGTLTKYRSDVRFTFCPDEFNDVALTSINNISNSCDFIGTQITINVKNLGSSAVSTLQAYYSANDAMPVHETINLDQPLNAGESTSYTFNTTVDLTDSSNVVKAWIELPADGNFSNNIAFSNAAIRLEPNNIPFVENFNTSLANDSWTILNNNTDDVTFAISGGKVSYTYNDIEDADDWIITSCIYLSEGRYEVAYEYNAANSLFVENFEVAYGIKVAGEYQLSNVISTHEFSNTDVVKVRNQIEITQGGVYYFGIHALSAAGNMGFSVDNFSIKSLVKASVYYAENGSGTPDGVFYSPESEPYTVTIVPNEGYHVKAIYKNTELVRGENANNAAIEYFTFIPNNNDSIYITFTNNEYQVNAVVENAFITEYNNNAVGATYNPNHEVLGFGATHNGVITVSPNYHIESVTVNGFDVTSNLTQISDYQYSLTISSIAENKNIRVVAALDDAKIIYTVNSGQGTINGIFTVDENTELPAIYTVTLTGYTNLLSTITPADGYHIESIIIDNVEHNAINMYSFEKLLGVHTVYVKFAKNNYNITTNAYGNGTVTPGMAFEYNPDLTYIFKATPAVGSHIVSVLRNGEELSVLNPEEVFVDTLRNISQNYNYDVLFAANTCKVTASVNGNGLITNPGATNYHYNTDATYTANASLGYYISSVIIDGEETVYTQADSLTVFTTTFENISTDHTIEVTFAQFIYTITVNAGEHGTISPTTSSYPYNAVPEFTIIADEGYAIVDVVVDGVSKGAITSYTFPALSDNHTISATFAAYQFTITATAGNGGSISPVGVQNMPYNGNKTFTITPSEGYNIANVYVDGVSVGAVSTYTFSNVTSNHTIYAVFESKTYTITVVQPLNGTITPSGVITVQHGDIPTFTFIPNAGYEVDKITVNTSTQVINNATHINDIYSYQFPAVTENKTITATMIKKTFTITASAGANGTISNSGTQTVEYGSTKTYAITPSAGYVVDKVTVDGLNMGSATSYTFTNIVANHEINATFKLAECTIPYNLQTAAIDSTSAVLYWYHPTAESFDIRYKTLDGTFNSVSSVNGSSYTLLGLTPSTTYMWQIRANCLADNNSEWSNMIMFTTTNPSIEVGIEDFNKNQIKVYAENQNIHIVNTSNVTAESVRVYDMYGKLLYHGTLNTEHEVINMNVAAGTYVVNVATENGVYNYKVTLIK